MVLIKYKKFNEYEYFESNTEYYYITEFSIIIDNNKNILIDSRIDLSVYSSFYNTVREFVSKLDLQTLDYITYENVIYIQHWYTTYGHFKDELFNLYNFYELFDKKHFNVLMNYKKPDIIEYAFTNYDELSNLLFDKNIFINAANLNKRIVKINNLIMIKHNLVSPMFHMFPQKAINTILSKINNETNFNKNIFITRGKALHLPRNLNNQKELEQHFLSINYNVINPELMNIELLINTIKNAENIYITWGGSMVNLCYVNPDANIYLLQSNSYQNEEIFSIFKFLRNYKNLYLIKCDNNNNININFENKIKLNYRL